MISFVDIFVDQALAHQASPRLHPVSPGAHGQKTSQDSKTELPDVSLCWPPEHCAGMSMI